MSFMEFSVTYLDEKTNNTERRRKTPVNYLIILLKVVAPLTNTGWSHTHTHTSLLMILIFPIKRRRIENEAIA